MYRTRRSASLQTTVRLGLAGAAAMAASAVVAAPSLAASLPGVGGALPISVGTPQASATAQPSSSSGSVDLGGLATVTLLPTPTPSLPPATALPTQIAGICLSTAPCSPSPSGGGTNTPPPTQSLGGGGGNTPPGGGGTRTAVPSSLTTGALASDGSNVINATSAGASFGSIHEILPPAVTTIGQVPGISFGQAPYLWPLFVMLDLVAAAAVIVVVRRTWSSSSAAP
ncbi:MAG: hypothetical protein ACYDAC_05360 [Candidatus Dormibacteria bacterium]